MNVLIIIILAAVCIAALLLTLKRFRKGGGCCGEHAGTEKAIRSVRAPSNESKRHVSIKVGGMTCENCSRRVANALNSIPGVKASVSISTKAAEIDADDTVTDTQLENAIRSAGYVPLNRQAQ